MTIVAWRISEVVMVLRGVVANAVRPAGGITFAVATILSGESCLVIPLLDQGAYIGRHACRRVARRTGPLLWSVAIVVGELCFANVVFVLSLCFRTACV